MLRQARLERGLSQRELCGDQITRNMLSQIENGTARPSMDTLRYLAGRLGKPLGYFLEEPAASPNQPILEQGRGAYVREDYAQALQIMAGYRGPDPVFDAEAILLAALCRLALAERAIAEGRLPYAQSLLEQAAEGNASIYFGISLERRRLLALAQARQGRGAPPPEDDRELLLRAKLALDEGDPVRAGQYLDAAEDTGSPGWNYLRGMAYAGAGEYERAAACLRVAELSWPGPCAAQLEKCCLALEDFKGAYHYACLRRELAE